MRPVYILEFYAHLFRYVTPNIILCIVRVITYTANIGTLVLYVFFKHDSNIYGCVARKTHQKTNFSSRQIYFTTSNKFKTTAPKQQHHHQQHEQQW